MMNCKQATHLISQSQDKSLGWRERIKLRLHLLICTGCSNYNKHMDFISKAMKQFRNR